MDCWTKNQIPRNFYSLIPPNIFLDLYIQNALMKPYLLSLLFTLSYALGFCQGNESYIFGNDSVENKYVSALNDDFGNVYLLTTKRSFDPNASGIPIDGYPNIGFTIHKLNANLKLQWRFELDNAMQDGHRYPVTNITLSNGRLYIPYIKYMGYRNCGANIYSNFDYNGLLCLDTLGNKLFDSTYSYSICGETKFLMSYTNKSNTLIALKSNNHIRFQKINSSGKLINETVKTYPLDIIHLLKDSNGIIGFGVLPNTKELYISRLDSNYNIISTQTILTNLFPSSVLKMIKDSDQSNYIISHKELIKLNKNYTLQWKTTLPNRPVSLLKFGVNNTKVFSNYTDSVGSNINITYTLNDNGLITSEHLNTKNKNYFIQDYLLHFAEPLMLGDTNCCYTNQGVASKVLIKKNNIGLGEQNNILEKNKIRIYQINDNLVIHSKYTGSKKFEIIDGNGREIMNGFLMNGDNIFYKTFLPKGLIIVKVGKERAKIIVN